MHFLHIGKTGGTALKHALKSQLVTSEYLIVLHGHRAVLREVPSGDKVIFCLRHPISRFVSAFYSRQRQGQPRFSVPWTPEEKVAFARFETPNQLALALSSPIDEARLHAQEAMRSIGHLRDGFMKRFESEAYFLSRLPDIFQIGFQETLAEDFAALKSKLNLRESVKLPADDVVAHRSPGQLDRALEDQAVENLTRWYADDIRFFDLCWNMRAPTPVTQASAAGNSLRIGDPAEGDQSLPPPIATAR